MRNAFQQVPRRRRHKTGADSAERCERAHPGGSRVLRCHCEGESPPGFELRLKQNSAFILCFSFQTKRHLVAGKGITKFLQHIHAALICSRVRAKPCGRRISGASKAVWKYRFGVSPLSDAFMLNRDPGLNAHKFTAGVHGAVSMESQAICYPHSRLWRRTSINLWMNY